MARDAAYGRWLAAEATRSGFPSLWVDGDLDIAAIAATVAASFQLATLAG